MEYVYELERDLERFFLIIADYIHSQKFHWNISFSLLISFWGIVSEGITIGICNELRLAMKEFYF